MESIRKEILFKNHIMKLILEIEAKRETKNELEMKLDFSDIDIVDKIMTIAFLKLQISELETKFENLFSTQ